MGPCTVMASPSIAPTVSEEGSSDGPAHKEKHIKRDALLNAKTLAGRFCRSRAAASRRSVNGRAVKNRRMSCLRRRGPLPGTLDASTRFAATRLQRAPILYAYDHAERAAR